MTDFAGRIFDFCQSEGLLCFDGVIVGLSGGPDSVALIKVLTELRDSGLYKGGIKAVHINHNLRPGDCDRDEAFVKDLCGELNIPLKCESFDIAKMASSDGRTEEEEGRIVRYRVFEKYRNELLAGGEGDYAIAVAHHGDDLAETFMMNLFRGAGLEGLRGIKPRNGNIVRPFLCVTKQDILDYLGDAQYCTDYTNSELNSTRNIWRNKILPEIAEVSIKTPQTAIRDTSDLLAADLDYISQETYRAFDLCKVECGKYMMIDCARAAGLHKAILSRVIRHLYLFTAGRLTDFETVNLNTAMSMLDPEGSDREQMPFGIVAYRQSGLFGFVKADEIETVMSVIANAKGFVTSSADLHLEIDPRTIDGTFTAKLPDSPLYICARIIENYEDMEYNNKPWFCPTCLISGKLVIEGNIGGMLFAKAGSGSSKQVRRIFTDLKAPREIRDRIIGISDDAGLCYIPGIGHGKGFVSPESRERCGADGPVLEIRFVEMEG